MSDIRIDSIQQVHHTAPRFTSTKVATETVFVPVAESTSQKTAMRRMKYQLADAPVITDTVLNAAQGNERYVGKYDVIYKGWVWDVHIDVKVWTQGDQLYAKVYGDTYHLIPIPGQANTFTVEGMPGSTIRFDFKGDKVKKVVLYLPKYGHMEGKPKK